LVYYQKIIPSSEYSAIHYEDEGLAAVQSTSLLIWNAHNWSAHTI